MRRCKALEFGTLFVGNNEGEFGMTAHEDLRDTLLHREASRTSQRLALPPRLKLFLL